MPRRENRSRVLLMLPMTGSTVAPRRWWRACPSGVASRWAMAWRGVHPGAGGPDVAWSAAAPCLLAALGQGDEPVWSGRGQIGVTGVNPRRPAPCRSASRDWRSCRGNDWRRPRQPASSGQATSDRYWTLAEAELDDDA